MTTDRVTILDVASRAGVAISSASAALNGRPGVSDETRERIRNAADDLGYVPSLRGRSLSSKRAFAVGLVVQRPTDVLAADPFFAAFIGGAESVLAEDGYALVLQMATTAEDALQRHRRLAADRRVDGVFLNEIRIDDPRVSLLTELGMPAVGINPDPTDFPFPSVRQDHQPGITSLIDHLIELGHVNIAHVSGPPEFIHTRQRMDAWREALVARGVDPGPVIAGDFTYEGGERAADQLVKGDHPTAVFCANDLMAIGLMSRAQELGLTIPDDLSVAGFDGVRLGDYVRPTLTSLQTSPWLMGAKAATILLDQVAGIEPGDITVEPAELHLGGSIGPARG